MSGEVLYQSTSVDVTFEAYLSSDHVTPATGKTIAVTISKNKAAFANPSGGATNATEIGNGSYYVNLTTTDTATLGPLILKANEATIDQIKVHYRVRQATNMDMTGIPNAAAAANGGLPTVDANNAVKLQSGTGANQISLASGLVALAGTQAFNNTGTWTGNLTGSLSGSVGSVSGNIGGNVAGSVGSVTGNVGGNVVGSVGSVTGLTAANLDVAVSTRLAAASYTAPDNAGIAAIQAKTDGLTFSVPGYADVNIRYVNSTAVTGSGTGVDPWGP